MYKINIEKYNYIIMSLILFSLILILYTFPEIGNLSQSIIGKKDAYVVIWNTYIIETGLHSGKPWTTHESFYPWGTSLLMHGSTPFLGLFTMLFKNKILALNIFILGMFLLSALSTVYLAKQFIRNNYFAIICGFVFAFSPYKMARIEEHYPLVFTALIPLFLAFGMKAFRFDSGTLFPSLQSKKYRVAFIVTALLCFIIDYTIFFQMTFLYILYSIFYILYSFSLLVSKKRFWIALVSVVITIHCLIIGLIHFGFSDNGGFWWGGKWIDYILPYNSAVYSKIGNDLTRFFAVENRSIESDMFLGYSLIIALFIAIIFIVRKRGIDLSIKALLFTLLMLFFITMPVIQLPYLFPLYSPTAILHFIPIIKNLRCPTRFINDFMLVAPIIIFYVLEQKIAVSASMKNGIATLLFLCLLVEYYPSNYSYVDYKTIPKVYYELARKPRESVLIFPLGLRDGMKIEGRFDVETMQYQTIHKKKTMGGYISRLPDWMWYVHSQNAFTNMLLQLEEDSLKTIPKIDYLFAMKQLKIDYVIIPQRYCNEKASLFLQTIVAPLLIQKEIINGDILLSLKR